MYPSTPNANPLNNHNQLANHITVCLLWFKWARCQNGFMVVSGGVLFEGYGYGEPGVCLAMIRRWPIWRIRVWRAWCLPGRWPDGGLYEGYGYDGPGVCLGDGHFDDFGHTIYDVTEIRSENRSLLAHARIWLRSTVNDLKSLLGDFHIRKISPITHFWDATTN